MKDLKLSTYTVTLNKKLVDSCKDRMKYTGSKLSPTINILLTLWIMYPISINNLLQQLKKEENKWE